MITPKVIQITSKTADGSVTLSQNTPGVRSEIFRFKAKLGQNVLFPNKTRVKGALVRGHAFVAKLVAANGQELDAGSLLYIAIERPQSEAPEYIRRLPYSIWNGISTTDQRDDNKKTGIAQSVDLNREKPLVLEPDHMLVIELKADVQVDWSKSYLEFYNVGEINQ